MRNEPNKKLIGLFMIIGVTVLAIIFGAFLKSKFYDGDSKTLVMYFEESINGLNVGAPVVFKGVQIGKVVRTELIANPDDLSFSIPVYVKMDAKQSINYSATYGAKESILNALIEKGLRARLTTQSYLTGQLMIELEMLPDTPVMLHSTRQNKNFLEIPTVLSPLGVISKGIQNVPLKASVEQFNKFFASLNEEMPNIRKVVHSMNKVISGNAAATSETIDNFNEAAINVSQAAKALRNFADYLERHPESLLKGKK